MKRIGILLLIAAALLAVAGSGAARLLPYAREIEDMALMRTLGVDAAGEGVSVTISTGMQNQGAEPPLVLAGQAGTISGALLGLQGSGASYIFYGHTGQLLLGEEQAARDLSAPLDYVLRDVEMRLDTELYVVRGETAGAAISAAAEQGKSAADRLEAMEADAGLLSHTMPRTVREVLADLSVQGASFAPAITVGGEGSLATAGYAVFRDNALAGWAEGDAARGVNLFRGEVDADILEVPLDGGGTAALRIVGAKTKVRPVFDGDTLAGVEVLCRVEANLAEGGPALDLRDRAALAALEEALSRAEEARLHAALETARALDADYLGLERAAGLAAPWRWEAIQAQWDLGALDLSVSVEGTVERGYDVTR